MIKVKWKKIVCPQCGFPWSETFKDKDGKIAYHCPECFHVFTVK